MDIPCYKCSKRTMACHDKCIDYKKMEKRKRGDESEI